MTALMTTKQPMEQLYMLYRAAVRYMPHGWHNQPVLHVASLARGPAPDVQLVHH